MKTSAPPPPPQPISRPYTFSGAVPHVLGLWSERLLKVRGRGDFAQSGASGRGVAQRRGGRNEGGRRRPRNTRGVEARGARPPHCLPAGQESFPHPGLMLLIASLGPQRKAARPGRLKSAHCSLRGQREQPPPPRRPEAGAGLQARGRLGSAQAQDELAGAGGGGKDRRSLGFCGPRLPSAGSWAPWHGRFHLAARRRWLGGDWPIQPGRPAKRCVFPGLLRARGTLCVCWWEWITGKLDGRYPAYRHVLYCLGVNRL